MKGKRTGSGKELGSAVSQPSSGLCCSLKQAGNGVGGGALPGWLMSAFREETRAFMRCMQRAQAAAERSPEPEDTQNRSRPGAFVLNWARFSHYCGSGRAVDCHIKSKEFSILIQPFLWP